jgi:hypothetical protein
MGDSTGRAPGPDLSDVDLDVSLEDATDGDEQALAATAEAESASAEAPDQADATATDDADAPSESEPESVGDEATGQPRDEAGRFASAAPALSEPAPTTTFVPPTGEPFAFRLDRGEIALRGAVQTPDGGVYFAPEAWRRVHANYLGDRHEWRQRESAHQRQLQEVAQQQGEREHRATALLAELESLFADKERLAAAYNDWERQAPILRAQAERKVAETRIQELEAREQQRAEQTRIATLIPQLQDDLGGTMESLLAEPSFAGIPREDAVDLLRDIWEHQRNTAFAPDGRGHFVVNREWVRERMYTLADRVTRMSERRVEAEKKKAANQAAVTPTAAKLAPKPAAKPKAKPGPKKRLTAQQWEDDFRKLDERALLAD